MAAGAALRAASRALVWRRTRQPQPVVLRHRRRVAGQLRRVRQLQDGHRSAIGVDESFRRSVAPARTGSEQRTHRQVSAARVEREPVRIPARGNHAANLARAGVDHGDGVDSSARGIQRPAVRRDLQRRGRDAAHGLRERLDRDRLHHLDALRIDHGNTVAVAVGHIQPPARFVQRERGRVQPHGERMRRLPGLQIHAGDRAGRCHTAAVHHHAFGRLLHRRGEQFVRLGRTSAQIAHPRRRALAVDYRRERRDAGLDLTHHFAARRRPPAPACFPTPTGPRHIDGRAHRLRPKPKEHRAESARALAPAAAGCPRAPPKGRPSHRLALRGWTVQPPHRLWPDP